MTPAVRTNTSSQYNWPIYDFFKVTNIKNDPANSHLFLLQLLLCRQNRITSLQPFAIYVIWLPMIIFTYIYHKNQPFVSVNIPVLWIRHGICIPCAYHSAPPLSVLQVNRFWTSQWMKSPRGRLRVDQTPCGVFLVFLDIVEAEIL